MATTISRSSQPSARETKLAKSLVHPEKSVRDATFTALVEYTRGVKRLSDIEMLKLWKALYYCMWLADKREVQEELADSFANVMGGFRNNKLKLMYIGMFFRILLREWSLLDMHRMNKFYYLIRVMVRKALQCSFEQLPKLDFAVSLNDIIYNEVLTQRPNGIRFHVSDLFVSELFAVSSGNCSTDFYLLSIEPFFKFLSNGDENIVLDRVAKSVFQSFAESNAREHSNLLTENPASPIFKNVDTRYIQAKLFDIASAPETATRYRTRLYSLHKHFAETTSIEFVDISKIESTGSANEETAESEKTKKNKKKKRSSSDIDETPAQDESEKKKKKKKHA